MKAEKFLQTSMDLYRKLHISTETTAHVGRDHKHYLEGEKLFNWARYLSNMGVTTEWISNLSKYMIVNKEYVFFSVWMENLDIFMYTPVSMTGEWRMP